MRLFERVRKIAVVVAVCGVTSAATWAVVHGHVKKAQPVISGNSLTDSVLVTIDDRQADQMPGFLLVSATAKFPPQSLDLDCEWFFHLRNRDANGHLQTIDTREYKGQRFHVKEGTRAKPTFRDLIQVPAGTWNVYVGLTEDRSTLHEDGTMDVRSVIVAESRELVVH